MTSAFTTTMAVFEDRVSGLTIRTTVSVFPTEIILWPGGAAGEKGSSGARGGAASAARPGEVVGKDGSPSRHLEQPAAKIFAAIPCDGTIAWRKLATGAGSTAIPGPHLPDNLDERLCNLDGRGIDGSSDQSLLNHIRTITGLPNSAMR